MKRFLGFNPNMYGDLYMMSVAARCLKRAVPDSHLTFVIAGDFRECAPIFLDSPHIDRVHILNKSRDGFDSVDMDWINSQRFAHVFNPMADHDHSTPWWQNRHQALEAAHMHGIPYDGDDGKITLTKWFKPTPGLEKFVAFSPWPSFHEGVNNPKAIPPAKAQEIVDAILGLGYGVLQVGGPTEPKLDNVAKLDTDYFTSVRNVLGCRAMVMGDSGFNWLLSGYDFPVVGLYSERYFGRDYIHNIQPINKNGRYLVGRTVSDIPAEWVIAGLRDIL
jgi:ADP-heptose:LPS heptosyltransferase